MSSSTNKGISKTYAGNGEDWCHCLRRQGCRSRMPWRTIASSPSIVSDLLVFGDRVMTYLSGIRVLRRGQDRLFDPMHKVLVILDGIGIGIAAALLGRIEPGNYSSATSGQFDILVKFPYLTPTESIARGQPMPEIAFCVPAEPTGADSSRKDANTSSGLWPIRHRNDHASLRGLFREEPSITDRKIR